MTITFDDLSTQTQFPSLQSQATPKHCIFTLLSAYQRFEKTAEKQASIIEDLTTKSLNEMDLLEESKFKEIEALEKSKIYSDTLGSRFTMLRTIGNVASIAFNLRKINNPIDRATSVCFIAAGVISLANTALSYFDGHSKIASIFTSSKETESKIATIFKKGLSYAGYGLFALGSYEYIKSGKACKRIAQAKTGIQNLLSRLPSKAVIDGGTTHMQACAEKKSHIATANIGLYESAINQANHKLHDLAKLAEKVSHTVGDILENVKQSLSFISLKN